LNSGRPHSRTKFLEAAPGSKYKAALSVAYSAGLRVSEVVALKVLDIDSERMMLRVPFELEQEAVFAPSLSELVIACGKPLL
jgi:integrase/recombinase XerD